MKGCLASKGCRALKENLSQKVVWFEGAFDPNGTFAGKASGYTEHLIHHKRKIFDMFYLKEKLGTFDTIRVHLVEELLVHLTMYN